MRLRTMILAFAEICGLPIPLILIWLCLWAIYHEQQKKKKASQQDQAPVWTSVSWTGAASFAIPTSAIRRACQEFFSECEIVSDTQSQQVFRRGDFAITSLPTSRPVRWLEIPVTITVKYSLAGTSTRCSLSFVAPPDLVFDRRCYDFFGRMASAEADKLLGVLEKLGMGAHNFDERTQADAETAQENEADTPPGDASDLLVLGLKHGASWKEVQAAYRQLCLKYHPDTLSGHQVPPHIHELAVERFRRITEAYQRLKERFCAK